MKVVLLSKTQDIENLIATAARLCYVNETVENLMTKLSQKDNSAFIRKILSIGHNSVLEHASFSFGVEGISRATSHQLVRHRIASYSQQSQRYVSLENFDYVIPDSIKKSNFFEQYKELHDRIAYLYKHMMMFGNIPPEDARFILPNSTTTRLIVTMNIRSLFNFFDHRLCQRAQWEIREMAERMLKIVQESCPIVFEGYGPRCVTTGKCPEGVMCCGKQEEMKEKYL